MGKSIKVRVSFTDDADHEETLTSAATGVAAAKPNSPATGAPTIDGTAQVGETLTVLTNGITDEDGLDNVSYSYQWIANDGTNDAEIGGQTGSTYTLTDEDVGKSIKVRVSFTDDADNAETTDQRGHRYRCGNEAGRPRPPERLPPRHPGAGRLLGSPGQRRRLRHYRLQGAVAGERRQLGHAGGRFRGDRVRNHPHHHGTDRRSGVQRAGPGHQRRG